MKTILALLFASFTFAAAQSDPPAHYSEEKKAIFRANVKKWQDRMEAERQAKMSPEELQQYLAHQRSIEYAKRGEYDPEITKAARIIVAAQEANRQQRIRNERTSQRIEAMEMERSIQRAVQDAMWRNGCFRR